MMMAHFSQAKSLNSTKFRCWLKINPQICCCCVVIHVICSLDKFASCFFSLSLFILCFIVTSNARSLIIFTAHTNREKFLHRLLQSGGRLVRQQHSGNVLGPQRQTKTESIFFTRLRSTNEMCASYYLFNIFFVISFIMLSA